MYHFSIAWEKKTIAAYGDETSPVNSRCSAPGRNNESHSFVIIFAPGEKYFHRVALLKA